MAIGDEVVQQPPETEQTTDATPVADWRLLFAQVAEPTKDMRIAAQLSEAVDLRVISMEIDKEAADNASISFKSARP